MYDSNKTCFDISIQQDSLAYSNACVCAPSYASECVRVYGSMVYCTTEQSRAFFEWKYFPVCFRPDTTNTNKPIQCFPSHAHNIFHFLCATYTRTHRHIIQLAAYACIEGATCLWLSIARSMLHRIGQFLYICSLMLSSSSSMLLLLLLLLFLCKISSWWICCCCATRFSCFCSHAFFHAVPFACECVRLSILPFLNGTRLRLVDVSDDVLTFIIRMNKMPKTSHVVVHCCCCCCCRYCHIPLYGYLADTRWWSCWFFLMLIRNYALFFSPSFYSRASHTTYYYYPSIFVFIHTSSFVKLECFTYN